MGGDKKDHDGIKKKIAIWLHLIMLALNLKSVAFVFL